MSNKIYSSEFYKNMLETYRNRRKILENVSLPHIHATTVYPAPEFKPLKGTIHIVEPTKESNNE